jgi:DNA-binding transcriptional LysR family regulator
MHITLRQLRIFEAVARHSSMSRAAAEMHLTQPAVSMQMKQLEELLGMALFEQKNRRLLLTEAGQELRRHAQLFNAQTLQLQSAMDQFRGMERGVLRVAVVSTANYFLTRLIGAYTTRYPGVRVSLQVGNRQAVLAALTQHATEIAITGEPPGEIDVEAQRFMENPLVVIAEPRHPLTQLAHVPLTRLGEERLVVREPGSGTRAATERYFAEHGVNYTLGCEFSSNEAIKQAVQAGLGLGVVSLQTIELELETRRLAVLPVEGFPIVRHWYIVHPREKRLSAASQAFRNLLLASVASPVTTALPVGTSPTPQPARSSEGRSRSRSRPKRR